MDTFDQLLLNCGLRRSEARLLLENVSAKSREWLIAHGDEIADASVVQAFGQQVSQRLNGEPLAYLLGSAVFMGRTFTVSPEVLIPRPETEVLVQEIIRRAKPNTRILELGCGSGIICISVALARPDLHVTATDVDEAALQVARHNARQLGCDQIKFLRGDWFGALQNAPDAAADNRFAVIASNPPYIADTDPHLGADGLPFEPRLALASGTNGLDAITHLVTSAGGFLEEGGELLLEHGYNQHQEVQALIARHGGQQPWSARDENGHWRVSGGTWRQACG